MSGLVSTRAGRCGLRLVGWTLVGSIISGADTMLAYMFIIISFVRVACDRWLSTCVGVPRGSSLVAVACSLTVTGTIHSPYSVAISNSACNFCEFHCASSVAQLDHG